MVVYAFRTTYRNGEVAREGVLDYDVDVSIEHLAPYDTTSDRSLWEVQKFLDKNYPEAGLKFEYEEIEINPSWEAK